MSLLLEALKKAELAKQTVKPAPEPDATRPAREPIITRESLPDISQPLEILANDLPSAASERASIEPTMGPNPGAAAPLSMDSPPAASMASSPMFSDPGAPPINDAVGDVGRDVKQAAARQMFEAKEMDYNPRRPFYITIGVLVVCAAGYGGYVWWQMQPRSLYNSAALKAAPKGAEANATAATAAAAPPGQGAAPSPAGPQPGTSPPQAAGAPQPPAPGAPAPLVQPATTPAASAAPAAAPPAAVAPGREVATSGAPARPATPAAAIAQASSRAAAPERRAQSSEGQEPQRGSRTAVAVAAPTASLDPQVEQAYDAFQRGDLVVARDQYQRALRQDPSSRDALLGLAAIDIRNRDFERAEARYIRLLENDPRDTHALAGIIALRGNIDPVQSESRLKSLIAQQPEAAQLHFILGNQFAARSRWPDAQAAYFKAYSLDPENPDYAFNLAVSLDQLRQPRTALEYYRKAVMLAGTKTSGFDKSRASARIAELTTP